MYPILNIFARLPCQEVLRNINSLKIRNCHCEDILPQQRAINLASKNDE